MASSTFSSDSSLSLDSGSQASINQESGHEPSRMPRSKNTIVEKRRMRNERKKRLKKRKRCAVTAKHLKRQLEEMKHKADVDGKKLVRVTAMARSYWERWRWELQKRREALLDSTRMGQLNVKQAVPNVHEIDETFLSDPIVNQDPHYLGRGSFGVVKLQIYRGIHVAVKELLPHSLKEDVRNEAHILAQLCHPYLPYLFGICIRTLPYRIVMQYHGILDESYPFALTVHCELHYPKRGLISIEWLVICGQLLEAVDYLHTKVNILHNNIKGDNIVIGKVKSSFTCTSSHINPSDQHYQILLVDFGKATKIDNGKLYSLNAIEKDEYRMKFPHIAPEVIESESKQTTYSDMFSVGGILYQVAESQQLSSCEYEKKRLKFLAEKCRLVQYHRRYSAQKALSFLQESLLNHD